MNDGRKERNGLFNIKSNEKTLTEMKETSRMVKKTLRRLPTGRLLVTREGCRFAFYQEIRIDHKRKRIGIGKDEKLIYLLAHKAYLTELLRRLEVNTQVCTKLKEKLLPVDDTSILGSLSANYRQLNQARIVDPYIIASQKQPWPNPVFDMSLEPRLAEIRVTDMTPEEWAAKPYRANMKNPENRRHRTARGILCRSRSEAAILEICDRHGYRYRYDETIKIGQKWVSPDIILIKPNGTLIYVEHRGWNGEEYDRNNMLKDNLYFSVGIVQGRNYLITFENADGSIDLELIERQLVNILGY